MSDSFLGAVTIEGVILLSVSEKVQFPGNGNTDNSECAEVRGGCKITDFLEDPNGRHASAVPHPSLRIVWKREKPP